MTDGRRRQGRRVSTALSVAAVAGTLLSLPALAEAGPRSYFKQGGCPPEYRAERAHSFYGKAKQRKTLSWRFKVHKGYTKLRPPVNWRMDPRRSRSFRASLNQLHFLDALIWIHHRTKDYGPAARREALRRAAALALDWVRAVRKGKVPKDAWKARVVAIRAPYLAYIGRKAACVGMLGNREARWLRASIKRHGRRLRHPGRHKPQNHGLTINLGSAILSRYFPRDDALARGARLARKRYFRAFRRGYLRSEGVWLEHSPGYYRYATALVDKWLRMVGGDRELRRARKAMTRSLAWLTHPDGDFAQFGDTYREQAPDEVLAVSRRQRGLWVARRSGYAVVKQPDSYLAIASAFHSEAHKHADELSFELFEDGRRIVADTGQYHKDRDRYYRFQRSSSAHSTLEVDGRPFRARKRRPYGSGLVAWGAGDGWYAVWGKNPLLKRRGVDHKRLFLYKPGVALVVADRVRSRERHAYKRRFQLGPEVGVSRAASRLNLNAGPFGGGLTSWSTAGGGTPQLARGQRKPLQGFTFPGFREKRARTVASWTTKGRSVDHAAVFNLGSLPLALGATAPRLDPDGSTVALNLAGVPSTRLTVSRSGSRLTVEQAGL